MTLKPTASLTSGLLVRKGDAAPSSGVFSIHSKAPALAKSPPPPNNSHSPAAPQSAQESAEFHLPTRTPVEGKRIAMTVRLDRERYIRLKTVGIHSRQSCQRLLTDALDQYLDSYDSDHNHSPQQSAS